VVWRESRRKRPREMKLFSRKAFLYMKGLMQERSTTVNERMKKAPCYDGLLEEILM
jgi:hypothetical protein